MEIDKDELTPGDTIIISEGIKLERLTKGNYKWTIKIRELDPDKIQKIDNEMFQRFGNE